MIRVTVWTEEVEKKDRANYPGMYFYPPETEEKILSHYPEGLGEGIAAAVAQPDFTVRTVCFGDPDMGLSDEILNETDVLIWWGHVRHNHVPAETVGRITSRVQSGMGAIFLHSSHESRPFRALIGTTGALSWMEKGESVDLWAVDPAHPIAEGVPHIHLDHEETYAEPFDIPVPDELVYIAGYQSGHVLRGGACFFRGRGRIFYFCPGHETYGSYLHPDVRRVLQNAVRWAAPRVALTPLKSKRIEEGEK